MARKLMDQGFISVRLIAGGFDAWTDAGYPVEPFVAASTTLVTATTDSDEAAAARSRH